MSDCRHEDEDTWMEHDARGISLTLVCRLCKDDKLRTYRPEVLNDPNYEADEPIESEPDIEMYPGGAAYNDVMGYNDDIQRDYDEERWQQENGDFMNP